MLSASKQPSTVSISGIVACSATCNPNADCSKDESVELEAGYSNIKKAWEKLLDSNADLRADCKARIEELKERGELVEEGFYFEQCSWQNCEDLR